MASLSFSDAKSPPENRPFKKRIFLKRPAKFGMPEETVAECEFFVTPENGEKLIRLFDFMGQPSGLQIWFEDAER